MRMNFVFDSVSALQLNSELAHLRRENQKLQDQLKTAKIAQERSAKQLELLAARVSLMEHAERSKSSKKSTTNGEGSRNSLSARTSIDDITCSTTLRKLLKESLRRNRAQRNAQLALEKEVRILLLRFGKGTRK